MPARAYNSTKARIKASFGANAYDSLWRFISDAKPSLWGKINQEIT